MDNLAKIIEDLRSRSEIPESYAGALTSINNKLSMYAEADKKALKLFQQIDRDET